MYPIVYYGCEACYMAWQVGFTLADYCFDIADVDPETTKCPECGMEGARVDELR